MLRAAGEFSVSDEGTRGKRPLGATLSVAMALLASALVLAVFASVGAGPAEARGNKTCSLSPRCSAVGWFWPERNERVNVSDNRTDGYGAILRFEYVSRSGQIQRSGAILDTKNNGHGTARNLNLPEGWSFSFRVCLWKNGSTIVTTCSRTKVRRT